ncbi:MAG TPA: nitronate monooxygenase [Terracidiphilus sp.]|nr:nitronate monooxygenase [Terracidiphilus sp.]
MIPVPRIIQGGMGIGVSNWRLANAVSRLGQLGVVSGTALDTLFLRRLADGDKGGDLRRGVDAFPFPAMARRVWQDYFVPGGKPADAPYPMAPMHQKSESRKLIELCIVSNFVEVFLAREGHANPVGVNYLEKVQLPHLASIYGAMLAGVGYVLMGAGIPLHIPAVLDAYAARRPAEYKLSVTGTPADPAANPDQANPDTTLRFDPAEFAEGPLPELIRPKFLAIVSSNALAATMLRRASGPVYGLVIESPTAGGHNAPPRGRLQLSPRGEPVYGPRDQVNLAELSALGVPFWLAGGYGSPARLREAVEQGAAGVQVGTAFAFAEESGLRADLKQNLLARAAAGSAEVFTDPLASPTGFPFKVAQVEGSLSEPAVYQARNRVCDLGYLREAYVTPEGKLGYRCSAEPTANHVAKGGREEDTAGRKCLCNALLANVGFAQLRGAEGEEPPLVTVGDDLNTVAQFLPAGGSTYSAQDVVLALLGGLDGPVQHVAPPALRTTA